MHKSIESLNLPTRSNPSCMILLDNTALKGILLPSVASCWFPLLLFNLCFVHILRSTSSVTAVASCRIYHTAFRLPLPVNELGLGRCGRPSKSKFLLFFFSLACLLRVRVCVSRANMKKVRMLDARYTETLLCGHVLEPIVRTHALEHARQNIVLAATAIDHGLLDNKRRRQTPPITRSYGDTLSQNRKAHCRFRDDILVLPKYCHSRYLPPTYLICTYSSCYTNHLR